MKIMNIFKQIQKIKMKSILEVIPGVDTLVEEGHKDVIIMIMKILMIVITMIMTIIIIIVIIISGEK